MATTQHDRFITVAHGNGGRLMRELIEQVFAPHLGNPELDTNADAVPLPVLPADGELLITTDGFTVEPLEFPGGDIGSLAVHGTVNDLAVSGATPLYMTLNAFIEEGMSLATLERLVRSMGEACRESAVRVVAGDTKVVGRGQGGGLYLATTGVGLRPHGVLLGLNQIRPGDRILVSGPVGDHGTAVLLAREQFGLSGELTSDAASVLPITRTLLGCPGLRFMRDPTRGGIATVAHEIARSAQALVRLWSERIPVRPAVRAVCDMLGYDPCYLACEGRVAAVFAPDRIDAAQAALRRLGHTHAAVIGEILPGRAHVVLQTPLGGERILEELEDDPLPRIC
ncbi:MAG: hydrogenase expression/formation protein HypE [Gammaproteobacteria bacterium]|nr:hydrogenase expression/formation protein HypE [Gammaproteobacteria bacterium]